IGDTALAELISNTPARCILLYEDIDAAFIDRSARKQATSIRGEPDNSAGVTLSGLLNTIDGVQAQESRLLLATTNHPERLDPALSRPLVSTGILPNVLEDTSNRVKLRYTMTRRYLMDVKIEYTHSTQWQAKELFRLFYRLDLETGKGLLDKHAEEFASAVPTGKLSVAQLQGYLMRYKGEPEQAAKYVGNWVGEALAEQSTQPLVPSRRAHVE
ncbi:hypothetical protein FRC11_012164, partial [Ceratobasidium sp. 423]